LFVIKTHIRRKIRGTDSANSNTVSFLSMSDSSWVSDTLKIGNIVTDCIFPNSTTFDSLLTVLLIGKSLSVRFAEIPRFYRFSFVGDNLSVGQIYETSSIGTTFLISVPEIFLKFIGIIGSIIRFSWEFSILGFGIKIRIRTSCCENSFYFFFIIIIGNFRDSAEIVFEWELIDNYEISSFILEYDFTTENIIIHRISSIPTRLPIPARYDNQICFHFHFGEWIFFLSQNESDLIGSTYFKWQFGIFLERPSIDSNRQSSKFIISGFYPNS
jgi:hypothetical protein